MIRQVVVVAGLGAMIASGAHAGVVPIGEFTGEMSDGFEAILPPGGYPGTMPIFGGTATMTDTVANFCVIALSWSGPAGNILPYNGNFMGGTVAGSTLFTFTTPVHQFGGWVNTIAPVPGGTVIFRDVLGNEISTLPLDIEPTEWRWMGWQSSVALGSVEITTPNVPGFGLQFDDLHISSVPAPATAAMLGLAGVLNRRRR